MTDLPTAPITQDVLTIPRKLPEGGRINLVGLTREQLARRADRRRHAGEAGEDARGPGLAVGLSLGRPRFRADDQPRQGLPRASGRALHDRAARGRHPPDLAPTAPASTSSASPAGMRSRRSTSPKKDRGTLCISSQVGCTLTCSFCHTGTQKLVRNLTAAEIVGQVMLARDDLDEWPQPGAPKDEDAADLEHRADGHGRAALQLRERARCDEGGDGRRGHRPSAAAASRCRPAASCPRSPAPPTEIGCLLAVSFHATTDEVRDRLVPINKTLEHRDAAGRAAGLPAACRTPNGSPSSM